MGNGRHNGSKQWDATRREFKGPEGVTPDNGLRRTMSERQIAEAEAFKLKMASRLAFDWEHEINEQVNNRQEEK